MSITYQQAKRIRKTGLMSLFADQLMYEKKVSTAIKKTISLKTRGKIMGITQYLDPLNIAKMLTFGSALGPALLGHFMKRDPRDIQYFTGRLKPIRERDTASKISKVSGGGGFSAEANATLHKIYTLLSMTHEENVKRRELAKNREEENLLEDERRHKELLQVLGAKPTATAIKDNKGADEGGGFFSSIFSEIAALGTAIYSFVENRFMGLIEKLNFFKNELSKIGPLFKKIFNFLVGANGIVRVLNTILGVVNIIGFILRAPLFGMALAGGLMAWGINKYKHSAAGLKRNIERVGKEIQIKEYEYEREKRLMPDSPQVDLKRKGLIRLYEEKQGYEKELDALESISTEDKQKSALDDLLEKLKDTEVEDFKMEGLDLPNIMDLDFSGPTAPIPSATPVQEEEQKTQPNTTTTTPAPKPAEPQKSSALHDVMMQNSDQKIALAVQKSNPQPIVNQNTVMPQTSQQVAHNREVPSVRNPEPSYRQVVYDNTVILYS